MGRISEKGKYMDFTGTIIYEFDSLPSFWWLWLFIVAVVVWLIEGRRISPRPLLATYILFILMETVIGRESGMGRMELIPFWSYSHPELRMEILLNYLLFMPLGLLLYLCFGEKFGFRVVIAGLFFSLLIEIVQLVFRIGLYEFDDMIGNTIGCFIGALIGKVCLEIIKKKEVRGKRNEK